MNCIEDLYEEMGGLGWYQVVIILAIISPQITVGWSMLQMSFAGVVPDFICKVPCVGVDDAGGGGGGDVSRLSESESCEGAGFRLIKDSLNKCSYNGTKCAHFEYHTDSNTVIVQWDLVCDDLWAKQAIISVQMVGVLVGTLFAGQLSDVFGRKKVLAGFVLAHLLFNFLAAFSTSWVMFACVRFLVGVGIGAVVVVVFPYVMEFLPIKWRPVAAIIPSWSLGVSAFAGFALWLKNWRYLHVACGVVSILTFIGLCCVPESIRWQVVNGKVKEAEETLAKIARHNKKPLPQATATIMKNFSAEQRKMKEKGETYTYVDLFRRFWTAKVSIILCLFWFSMSVAYYGIAFGVASLSGNLYLNLFLLGVMEIPAQTTTFFLNNRFGRRKTTMGFFIGCLLPALGCFLFQVFARGNLRSVGINVFSMTAKVMVGCVWSCVQLWGNEIYPTVIRNLGAGFSCLGARVGGIAAPFMMNLDEMPGVAYGILCVMLLADTILTLWLPEMGGKALSDVLDHAKTSDASDSKAEEEQDGLAPRAAGDVEQPWVAESAAGTGKEDDVDDDERGGDALVKNGKLKLGNGHADGTVRI